MEWDRQGWWGADAYKKWFGWCRLYLIGAMCQQKWGELRWGSCTPNVRAGLRSTQSDQCQVSDVSPDLWLSQWEASLGQHDWGCQSGNWDPPMASWLCLQITFSSSAQFDIHQWQISLSSRDQYIDQMQKSIVRFLWREVEDISKLIIVTAWNKSIIANSSNELNQLLVSAHNFP